MNRSNLLSVINTKTVTKLVLLGEIIAICVLHSVKLNQVSKPATKEGNIIYNLPKKFPAPANITLANNKGLLTVQR